MDPSLAPLDARRLVELPMIARLEPCQACPQCAGRGQGTAPLLCGDLDPHHYEVLSIWVPWQVPYFDCPDGKGDNTTHLAGGGI
jgi:hypothetical protein